MYKNDCIEVQYLFEILHEMILPLTLKGPDLDNYEKYSKYEMRMFHQKRFLNIQQIQLLEA